MDPKLLFVDRLLQLERRIGRIYQKWAAHENFPADLRSFCKAMADDEQQHLTILERSAGLLNFASTPPASAATRLKNVETAIAEAERFSDRPDLEIDGLLSRALALESSELNQLDDTWLASFQPDLGKLTQGWAHAHEEHLHRLYDATSRFTANENLYKQAAALLSRYELEAAAHGT
ncbi:MAG TPA: hypothetical protein VFY96_15740 [Candidatus Binatia bacterium]|nr:hypothetical protein [Candidatus Binatia bacterium]